MMAFALSAQEEQYAAVASFPTMSRILESLEKHTLVEPPAKKCRKSRQAATAHIRAEYLLRGSMLAPKPGRDVFERMSIFYKEHHSRAVVGFCSHKEGKRFGYMSNWFKADFTFEPSVLLKPWLKFPIDEAHTYRTAEEAIMHMKASIFEDRRVFDFITEAYNQDLEDDEFIKAEVAFLGGKSKYTCHEDYIKSLGQRISGFEEDAWQQVLLILAVSVVSQKFLKRSELAAKLAATGDAILVEAADYDSQWGVLLKEGLPHVNDLGEWRGWNVLGEALMITRHHLLTGEDIWQQALFSTKLPQ